MEAGTQQKTVELTLTHDTKKVLKAGKRRYSDADGHNLYLTGDEVHDIDSPDAIEITVRAKA
jgi:hypothetical protein